MRDIETIFSNFRGIDFKKRMKVHDIGRNSGISYSFKEQ